MPSYLTTRQRKGPNLEKIFEVYIALGSLAANGEVHEIIDLISSRHYQFRVIGIVQGFWEENPEDTLLVQVSDNEQALEQTVEKLKSTLIPMRCGQRLSKTSSSKI